MTRKIRKADWLHTCEFWNSDFNETFIGTLTGIERSAVSIRVKSGQTDHIGRFDKATTYIRQIIN